MTGSGHAADRQWTGSGQAVDRLANRAPGFSSVLCTESTVPPRAAKAVEGQGKAVKRKGSEKTEGGQGKALCLTLKHRRDHLLTHRDHRLHLVALRARQDQHPLTLERRRVRRPGDLQNAHAQVLLARAGETYPLEHEHFAFCMGKFSSRGSMCQRVAAGRPAVKCSKPLWQCQ